MTNCKCNTCNTCTNCTDNIYELNTKLPLLKINENIQVSSLLEFK